MTHSLLKPPGGLFIMAGAVFILAVLADRVLGAFEIQIGQAGLGRSYPADVFYLLATAAPGVYLIVLGLLLQPLARIASRLQAIAQASVVSR